MADGLDLSELVRRTVQANAKFYKGWMDLSFEYFRGISEIFGGATQSTGAVQEVDTGAGVLVLEGEAGSVVRGSFLVSNDMDKPVSCAFVASDFKDPRGASVLATAAFEPASLQLAPGEQRVVQVAITVDDKLSPGVGYAGEIAIKGMDGFSVPVVLRRQHTVQDSPIDDARTDEKQRASDSDASRTPRGKAASKKGSRKRSAR
jgi:hypothetical protein